MGGSSGGGSSTTTQKLDPFVRQQTQENLRRADEIANRPYQPYSGPGVVGFNDAQQQAQQGLIGIANSGLGQQAQQQAQQQANSVINAGTPQVDAQAGGANMAQYQNPYQQQVLDRTMQSLDRQRQLAVNQGQDASISAGAYDGSRSALADAATNEGYARQQANTAARINQQGYDTALSASQNDADRDLGAQRANQDAQMQRYQQMLQGSGLLSRVGQQQYQNAINDQQLIAGTGDARQALSQDQADYDRAEWERQQSYDQRMLDWRSQLLNGSPLINAGSQSTQGPGRSRTAGALGGAASGAGVGSMIGGPGIGTAIGAGVGGTAGLLGII